MLTFFFIGGLLGAGFEHSVAKVRLQQGGLHPRFVSEVEGEHRAELDDARRGLGQHGAAAAGDLQTQLLTG